MRQKRNSLEQLLKRSNQRLSLDLPEPSLQPVASPVDEGWQVALRLPPDEKVAAAHLIKGLEGFNQGLVGVAEKIHAEVEEERAARRGEAVSAAVDKHLIRNDEGQLEWVFENLPGASAVDRMVNEEGQELDENAKRNIAAAIDAEATQRLGFPEKRRKALELMKAEGMDVTNFPRMLRLFDSLVAEKHIDAARRHIDTNWAALTEPGSTLTVQGMALEAMQTVTGDKTLEWSDVLGMSAPMAQGFKDLVSKKEGYLLPAKSVAKQKEIEKRVLDIGRTRIGAIVAGFADADPKKAIKATANIRDMFLAVQAAIDTEGGTGGTRIREQLWRELQTKLTEASKKGGAFENRIDVNEAADALAAGLEAYYGEGASEPLLKLDPDDPDEEDGLFPDPVKEAGREANAQEKARDNTAKGNPEPESRDPSTTHAEAWRAAALGNMGNRERTVVADITKYSNQRIATGKLFTLADGKTPATLAERFRERPNYLTDPVEGDELHELVDVVMSDLDTSTDSFSKAYQSMANKAEKETMVRGIVQAQIQEVMDQIIHQDVAAMSAANTVLTHAGLVGDKEEKARVRAQNIINDARVNEAHRRATNASEHYETIWSSLHAAKEAAIAGGGEVGKSLRAVFTELSGKMDEEGHLLLSSSHADYPKLKAFVESHEGIDAYMSDIVGTTHNYAYGKAEVAHSTDTGELPPTGVGGIPTGTGGAFSAYGEGIAQELQAKAVALAENWGRRVWDNPEIRAKIVDAKSNADRNSIVVSVSKEMNELFDAEIKKLHDEGIEYRDAVEGKASNAESEITDVMAAYNESLTSWEKVSPLVTASIGKNVTPFDLISLVSPQEEVGVRQRMFLAGDTAAAPMLQLIDIVGSGNYEALAGWDHRTRQATFKTTDDRELTVSVRHLQAATAKAAKEFGFPMRLWATDGDPATLTQGFIDSASTGTNTPLFNGLAELQAFEEEHGPEALDTLRTTLLEAGKLGRMANGNIPSPEEFRLIVTKNSYRAARMTSAFDSSNAIASRNATATTLGWRERRDPRKRAVVIGSPEARRMRQVAYKKVMPEKVRVVPSGVPIMKKAPSWQEDYFPAY